MDAKHIVFVQRVLPHYRVAFFERLAAWLAERGLRMTLVYGQERPGTVPRSEHVEAPWARRIANRYWRFGRHELVWQPCRAELRDAELVIVEQANRLLLNYLLLLGRGPRRARVALWGHGRNLQSPHPSKLTSRWTRAWLRRADWWFAYTALSARIVAASGFPQARITTVDNSLDAAELARALTTFEHRSRRDVAAGLGLQGANLAVFCGALHEHKRLEFLFAAARRVRAVLPDFELAIVGSGPLERVVRSAAEREPWVQWRSELRGPELAPYLYAARVLLMPGLVGLVAIHSFVAARPLVTTDIAWHSPEIEYLENDANGLVTADDLDAYAAGVVAVLTSDELRLRLEEGCRRSAARYTLGAMVEHFGTGILACRDAARRTPLPG